MAAVAGSSRTGSMLRAAADSHRQQELVTEPRENLDDSVSNKTHAKAQNKYKVTTAEGKDGRFSWAVAETQGRRTGMVRQKGSKFKF